MMNENQCIKLKSIEDVKIRVGRTFRKSIYMSQYYYRVVGVGHSVLEEVREEG